jgi:hypothetical protein
MEANIFSAPVWPAVDWCMVNSIVEQRNPSCLEDLKPQHYRNGGACELDLTATQFIDALLPGNPYLNFSENQMEWMGTKQSFRGTGMHMMRPSPYMVEWRKYLVVRFSNLIPHRQEVNIWSQKEENLNDVQSYMLVTLSTKHQPRLPLVVVTECADVWKGWFSCEGVAEETIQAFFNRAIKMGADAGLWDKHAKVLVPGGAGVNGYKATIELLDVADANEQAAHNAEGGN